MVALSRHRLWLEPHEDGRSALPYRGRCQVEALMFASWPGGLAAAEVVIPAARVSGKSLDPSSRELRYEPWPGGGARFVMEIPAMGLAA
jgi:hypothetical protein